jgi:hypothetical protein
MKKIFTILLSFLTLSAFAATEQAWYNDVTSIAANGQYYIYSPKGEGFMQAGNSAIKAINQNTYKTTSGLLFTIVSPSGGNVYNGSNYLYSYQAGSTCGPVHGNGSDKGTKIVWTLMENGAFWNIHSLYDFLGNRYAALYYTGSKYDAVVKDKNPISQNRKDTYTDIEYQWYVISQAHYDRHWAIYLYDRYKETITDYTQWENLVPASYYTALADAFAVTYNVKNTAHSKDVVNAHRADLKALYDNAAAVAQAYANAKDAINALEAVEDKGEDFAEVTADILAARTAIEQAMSVDALNAVVAGLKAIDPITFNQTSFEALTMVNGAASSTAGRTISYAAADNAIINAAGKAIYAGTTTLTATAAATDQYYKFVRSAQVTVTAWETFGEFEQTTCDEAVEFNNQTYEESFAGDVNVGKNYIGGDSTVHVNIVINHATFGTDTKTIVYGDDVEWNGVALKDSTVGTHTVLAVLTNAAGCDSTVTLTLTVNKLEMLNVPVDLTFCAGDSAEFRGKWYFSVEDREEISAEGATRDTLYVVNVTVLQPSFGAEEMTIYVGEEIEWNGIALKDSTVGEHTVIYETTNVAGCDSVVTLTLTVNKMDTLEVYYPIAFCAGDSAEYRGKWYYESGEDTILVEDAIQDTLIYVTIAVLPTDLSELKADTLYVGDTLFIEADTWYLGETLVADTIIVPTEAGEFDLTQTLKNESLCDSVIVRHIVVETKPENPTALDTVGAANKAAKILRNGVIYIRREGKEFTIDGRVVK